MKRILIIVFGILFLSYQAQDIQMEFPHFKGKTYDFIIFQGSTPKVISDTIPDNGKFTLSIPKEYAPYTGMSRWLITGTQEGGGLDMLIPGHDFSVSSKEAKPDDSNIIYTENTEIPELNALYKKQQEILAKYDVMFKATKAFPKNDKNYPVFEKEYEDQLKAYEKFQQELKKKDNYAAKFISIVNITQGIGTKLLDSEEEKAKNIATYMSKEMDWQALYTSGHWNGIIASWIGIHTLVLNDPKSFTTDFKEISKKIKDPKQYTDFVQAVTSALNQNGKDSFITAITPLITKSDKIISFDGPLAVYKSATEGTRAPDLNLRASGNTILKSSEFAGKQYRKTLIIFYKSDCGACEQLLQELPEKYGKLKARGVRIISISADADEVTFKSKSRDFPWKDAYRDDKSFDGINFKNYAVSGTPTLILVDSTGKIVSRRASLKEIMETL